MSVLTLTRSRGGLLLSPAVPPTTETADQWLIGLRWLAILGMLATALLARRLVPDLALAPLLAVLAGIAALNVGWHLVVSRREGRPPLVAAQVLVDVVALSVVLWLTGGTGNPFAVFLAFHIVLAGLLCGRRFAVVVTALALLAVLVLSFAPPLPLASAPLGAAAVRGVGGVVALVNLSAFIGFFVSVYVQRVEQLRAESARNEKLAVLGRLVGTLSHELNTPLATILLASKDLAHESDPAESARLAQTIASEAERAGELVGLVRGHVRPDVHPQRVDVAALARDVTAGELARLGFGGERVVDTPATATAVGFNAGLRQALSNVITNAVQAVHGRPQPRVAVRVRARRARVNIAVEDNGPGISPSLLGRLGEPFQTTKEDSGGMGLGLYVSSLLVERMGGSLAVEPLARGGTRVTLTLEAA